MDACGHEYHQPYHQYFVVYVLSYLVLLESLI